MSDLSLFDSFTAVFGGLKVSCCKFEQFLAGSSTTIALPMTSTNSIFGPPAPEKAPGVSEVHGVFTGIIDNVATTTATINTATNQEITITTANAGLTAVLLFSFD